MDFESSRVKPGVSRHRWGRTGAAPCAVAASAVLMSGCGDDDGGGGEPSPGATTGNTKAPSPARRNSPSDTGGLTEDQAERKALLPSARISYDKAARTAVGEVRGGKLTGIELKDGPQWMAEVAAEDGTAHRVRVDAVPGRVTQSGAEADQDADDKREPAHRLAGAEQSWEQAARTATEKRSGTVGSVKLDDNDSGALIWSVDVVTTDDWNKTTFDIDAAAGTIVREHVDRG
ncbi:PepSY domain-containing protein [Streptomyces sp. Wb2n-11]|uniref:PepSY domain-containing protein n=1 Tax=Streptomyces sp. Wb2n-11 TaxID=1030533 RepID=UPI000ABD571E|nr:PepSY domain-containing protein [Streptomyces sp. Wb2n-11]